MILELVIYLFLFRHNLPFAASFCPIEFSFIYNIKKENPKLKKWLEEWDEENKAKEKIKQIKTNKIHELKQRMGFEENFKCKNVNVKKIK